MEICSLRCQRKLFANISHQEHCAIKLLGSGDCSGKLLVATLFVLQKMGAEDAGKWQDPCAGESHAH